MQFISANTIEKGSIISIIDTENPKLCSIECASDPCAACCADSIYRKGYPILVTEASVGFCYKKATLFITSTAKQKGCSYENLLHI